MKANTGHQIPSDHAPNIPEISKQYLRKKIKNVNLKENCNNIKNPVSPPLLGG